MATLTDLSKAIGSVAAGASSSVVGIGRHHRGSGIVVADGRVLTNAHNIRGEEVTVRFAGGRTTVGTVAGMDVDGDLAVINVDTSGAGAASWAEGAGPAVGDIVFGVAATSSGDARVTFGTVSAVSRAFRGPGGRRIAGSLEHTAPLAPGSSGGPLVNAEGKVVGLNTNRIGEGFYLALPMDAGLKARVDALSRGEGPKRRRLGVAVAPGHVARRLRRSVGLPDRDGILVRGVEDGSLAAGAGVQEGDLIVSVGGTAVVDPDDLMDGLDGAGSSFDLGVVRGADELTLKVSETKGSKAN
jgi:S1-C subfamily serine protease